MESKRKSNGNVGLPEDRNDDRGVKRIKLSRPASQYGETPKETTKAGLELLNLLRNNVDKSGRAATIDFHYLPPRKGNEQYYAQTKAPMAFDTVERRLRNHEFATLSELESYLKRLVQNCKDYYPRESVIHKDAERIRKLTTTWMQSHNPAYADPKGNYAPYPTVITDDLIASHPPPPLQDDNDADAHGEADNNVAMDEDAESDFESHRRGSTSATPDPETPGATKRKGRPPKSAKGTDAARQRRVSSTPAPQAGGFSGLTFQQAQEKILEEMTHEKQDEEDEIPKYDIFARLPDRKLFKDYYAVIPHPVSFATLKRGIKGGSSGVSKFATWDEFDEEVSLIWKNARHYNEDGSFISELAGELEVFFNKRLRAARKMVPEPQQAQKPQIKLKLNAGQTSEQSLTPRHTLRMVVKDSPADSPALTPLSSTTSATNLPHRRSSTIARQSSQAAATAPSVTGNTDRGSSVSNSADGDIITAAPVKPEQKPSPAMLPTTTVQQHPVATPAPLQLDGNAMAPPAGIQQAIPTNGILPNDVPAAVHTPPVPKPVQAPPIEFDSKWRLPGKNAANALLTKLHLSTHPGLNLRNHFHMDIPASETRAQQSITINLPHTHYYLQITPTLNASVAQRQFKTFAMAGSQRLLPMPTIPGQPVDQLSPLYEARLRTGVNMIEVTVIAAPGPDAPKGVPAELEKFTIFANLMRA